MNKNEAKKRVKDLEHSLIFHKKEYEAELSRLTDEVKLYKGWFETSREDNKKLTTENNKLFTELKTLKEKYS